ncbi:MAG TPA: hypothetical protein VH352_07990 [Pseudonocardiaceae bacterium]|jgi:hypothetical protein|nr:hypothetical protein [Pseudonocardiaceae bacterium]
MRRSVWLWLLVIAVLVLLLGLLFGGYRKGTPVGVPAHSCVWQGTIGCGI